MKNRFFRLRLWLLLPAFLTGSPSSVAWAQSQRAQALPTGEFRASGTNPKLCIDATVARVPKPNGTQYLFGAKLEFFVPNASRTVLSKDSSGCELIETSESKKGWIQTAIHRVCSESNTLTLSRKTVAFTASKITYTEMSRDEAGEALEWSCVFRR